MPQSTRKGKSSNNNNNNQVSQNTNTSNSNNTPLTKTARKKLAKRKANELEVALQRFPEPLSSGKTALLLVLGCCWLRPRSGD
jgi:ribosomal protein L18E